MMTTIAPMRLMMPMPVASLRELGDPPRRVASHPALPGARRGDPRGRRHGWCTDGTRRT
jgi:hypothetical protein